MRGRGPGFREVLGVREFRALWAAELFSILGDQLARVALAILVFHRTSSAALSALTYALTFAPAILGGALLSGLADRYPRRRVLIATDLLRATLAAAMAIPSLPLPALWVLVGLLSMASAPFKAAQLALLPQVLDGDRYITGLSLRQITGQSAQLVGFASGGLLLTAVEPHIALAANAVTFLISAGLIVGGVRSRQAAARSHAEEAGDAAPGTERSGLLPVLTLVCLAGLFVVPEGIAAPYGSAIGAGATGVGLLMAADPLGSVIGAWLIARIRIAVSPPAIVALAAASGVPLMLCAPGPGLAISIALWALSGALSTAYLIHSQAMVVTLVPDHRRGRVMGRLATCLYASSGLAIVGGGIAAEVSGPFRSVAAAGLLGTVIALCVGVWWRRVARSRRDLVAGSEPNSAGEVVDAQSSLFAMTDASSQARTEWVSQGEIGHQGPAAHQSSLFITTRTSSSCRLETNRLGKTRLQSSLFATTDTSSFTCSESHLGKTRFHSSLFTTGTSSPVCSETNPGDARAHSSLFTTHTSSPACSESDPGNTHSSLFTTGTSSPICSESDPGKTAPQSSLFATTGTSSHRSTWDDSAEKTGLQSSLFAMTGTSTFVRNEFVYPHEIRHHSSLFDMSGTSSSQVRDESDSKQDRDHQSSLFVTTGTSSQADSRDGRGFPVAVHRLRDRVLTQAPSLWGWLCGATGTRLVFERG